MSEVTGTDRISIDNVESWVRAMGCKSSRITIPDTNWVLEVQYPIDSTHLINIVSTTRQPLAVAIVTGCAVSPEHVDAFGKLTNDAKKEFRWELVKTLSNDDVEFNLKETPDGRPQSFEIMATRYWDGLSLDAFARSMFAVYKTEIAAINCVRRFL